MGVKPEVELFKGQLPVADNGGIHVDGSLRPCVRLFLSCWCFVTALFPPFHASSAAVFLCHLQPPLAMADHLHEILLRSQEIFECTQWQYVIASQDVTKCGGVMVGLGTRRAMCMSLGMRLRSRCCGKGATCKTFSTCSMPGTRPVLQRRQAPFNLWLTQPTSVHSCKGRRVDEGACARV